MNETKGKWDILTLDDVALEIRVNVTMMRNRKRNEARMRLLHAEQVFAAAGYPVSVELPEVRA